MRCLLVVTIVAIIGGFRAENSDVNDGTGMDFPSCNETDSVSCTMFCTRSECITSIKFIQLLAIRYS